MGVRNLKLRFSRKLLFVAGLLTAFTGVLAGAEEQFTDITSDDEFFVLLADLIRQATDVTPLDKLAAITAPFPSTGVELFASYDLFLQVIDDASTREHLDALDRETAANDEVFNRLRDESYKFRMAIDTLFFELHPQLPQLIRRYGVF